jgi:hypothetical protein
MTKQYQSFEEIDNRLKILSLQREISQESMKLNLNRAKADLIPRKLSQGLDMSFGQGRTLKNVIVAFAAKKLLSFLRNRRQQKKLSA